MRQMCGAYQFFTWLVGSLAQAYHGTRTCIVLHKDTMKLSFLECNLMRSCCLLTIMNDGETTVTTSD